MQTTACSITVNYKFNFKDKTLKGPVEHYSEMMKKSDRTRDVTNRRSQIEYSELEYKTRMRLKLEEKQNKVRRNRKYLDKKHEMQIKKK